MPFNINEITSQLQFGGARPSHFQVQVTNPINATGDLKLPFMCKAASLPPSTLGSVPVFYFGREYKLAGDRTYPDWTVTIINDEDFLVRNALEAWSYAINSAEGNIRNTGTSSPDEYKSQATITQLSKTGVPIRTYQFTGLWPMEVSPIELGWEQSNAIEEFQVTFQYDYYTILPGLTGDGGTNS